MKSRTDMNPDKKSDAELLARILGLPHKILMHHDVEGLSQLILHELGHRDALSFDKAGYLIDNPEFKCLRGVAGFAREECDRHKPDLWATPHSFADDMKDAPFHRQLASFTNDNVTRANHEDVDRAALEQLGKFFGMKNPSFMTWRMKHGNNGILIFETLVQPNAHHKDLLNNVTGLLSLC